VAAIPATTWMAGGTPISPERAGRWRATCRPAARSPLAVETIARAARARAAIIHVRKATRGQIAERNCHPFVRRLWGLDWAFAHNGNLEGLALPSAGSCYQPLGETDSEAAFCRILDALRACFGELRPPAKVLHVALSRITAELASHGSFNYLLSDGEYLFAHRSTDLYYLVRRAPFAREALIDCDIEINLAGVNHLDDHIVIVATQPLTHANGWRALEPGRVTAFRNGAEWCPGAPAPGPTFAW